jgi:hypothetical protein
MLCALGYSGWPGLNEVKALGSRNSTQRTAQQTEVARFWEYSLPPIYHAVARSVALAPGRTVAQNARLFAAASQAMGTMHSSRCWKRSTTTASGVPSPRSAMATATTNRGRNAMQPGHP